MWFKICCHPCKFMSLTFVPDLCPYLYSNFSLLLFDPGIVETGLFVGMACIAYLGSADGSVVTIQK